MEEKLPMWTSAVFLLTFLLGCASPGAGVENSPLKVCLVSGSNEYRSDVSLSEFQSYLETHFNVQCTLLKAQGRLNRRGEYGELPGLEALDDSDVVLFFSRRITIQGDQLERIKKYCEAGRPIVAVRTASHGFQNWLEFDRVVLGGNYQGHYGETKSPATYSPAVTQFHPLLEGVGVIQSLYTLYKNDPVAEDTQVLMTGSTVDGTQPAAWTRLHNGGRVFYTSIGGLEDFKNPSFMRLLVNALFWTARREVEPK